MSLLIVPICYCIVSSFLILFVSYKISNTIPYQKYIKLGLVLYTIQISGIIHELAHYSQTENTGQINIDTQFYIPIIGFIWSSNVYITVINIKNNFCFGTIGFIVQFIYLHVMIGCIYFKSILALFLTSFSCIFYLFIYAYVTYSSNTSDFKYWAK
jgi:hypothetical protein